MNIITAKSKDIKIKDHIGLWYVIDHRFDRGRYLFLLESQTFGDTAPCLIADSSGEIILDNVWNGFEELKY